MKRFIIDHIDPLGQGVFKEDENIYFIPKTLPEETGTFKILKSKKGVHFGQLQSLDQKASNRIKPECEHFESCPGCHFLHTDYDSELSYKLNSFKRLLAKIGAEDVDVSIVKSPTRLHYRNRIQLHYHLKSKSIGFMDGKTGRITSVKNCQIMNSNVQVKFKELIANDAWLKTAKKHRLPKGHVEIYDGPEGLNVTWNKRYAAGGFTQVNQEVNTLLKEELKKLHPESKNILDLFGGAGNFSSILNYDTRACLDLYPHQGVEGDFHHINLFEENSLQKFLNLNAGKFTDFIIDPPRKGFELINDWVNHYEPNSISYISCHPHTLIRDIQKLKSKYTIKKVYLIDYFASTFHYEAFIHLEKEN